MLFENELAALRNLEANGSSRRSTIDATWPLAEGESGSREGDRPDLRRSRNGGQRRRAHRRFCRIARSITRNVAVPMLLATGAVHHHLIRAGQRMKASIICETGEARDTHQIACLIGYGASAICPYLGFETRPRNHRADEGRARSRRIAKAGADPAKLAKAEAALKEAEALTYAKAVKNVRKALEDGLLKIMSKMGISVLGSYHGAQIFEAIGIGEAGHRRMLRSHAFAGRRHRLRGDRPRIAHAACSKAFAAVPAGSREACNGRSTTPGTTASAAPASATPSPRRSSSPSTRFVKTGNPDDYKKYVDAVCAQFSRSPSRTCWSSCRRRRADPDRRSRVASKISASRFTTAGMSLGALCP